MRRSALWLLGYALLALSAATAHAQESVPIPLVSEAVVSFPKLNPLLPDEAPKLTVKISPNTGMPILDTPEEQKIYPVAELAALSSDYLDVRYAANSAHPNDIGLWERLRDSSGEQIHRLVKDYKTFYWSENLLYVGLAVGIAAPIANTHADQGIRDWYQRQAGNGQSRGADDTAMFFKKFGEYKYAIPIYVAFSLTGTFCPDSPFMSTVGDFGNRSLRALAVGAPTVGVLQVGLGSGRPYTGDSHWHPFRNSNAASGHAFVGAIPFLTAASMTESRALKALLIAGSLAPAWSRIHTDDHYFSQILLGWSIAYLSVQAVNQTECDCCRMRVVPIEIPNGVGMGVEVKY